MRILIYLQQLLGSGHRVRMHHIARALALGGHEVSLVDGGINPTTAHDDITLYKLPGLRAANLQFQGLLMENAEPIDQPYKELRCQKLLQALQKSTPDLVIIEGFPLARASLAFELVPFLETIKQQSITTVLSLRDIVIPKKDAQKHALIFNRLSQYIDHIMVHGDANIYDLGKNYPGLGKFRPTHCGYVCDDGRVALPTRNIAKNAPIVVSCGGGAAGAQLMEGAARFCAHLHQSRSGLQHPWYFLLGSNLPTDTPIKTICQNIPNCTVRPALKNDDFRQLLATAHLSISQGGYNTVCDILISQTPALIVPFQAGGHEKEQAVRTTLLANLGYCAHLPEAQVFDMNAWHTAFRATTHLHANIPIALDGAKRVCAFIDSL